MDKWLANLQKVAHETPAASAKREPKVQAEFADLVKVCDSDDDVAVPTLTKIFDGDPDDADVPSPVDKLFSKAARFDIPEPTPQHADGIEYERHADGTLWTFTWNDGEIIKTEWREPDGQVTVVEKNLDPAKHGQHTRIYTGENVYSTAARNLPLHNPLEDINDAWDELLGRGGAFPEKRPEVAATKKKAAASETYIVDGKPLAKSEMMSRMFRVVEQLRADCQGQEADLLDKAVRALDITAFAELAETVLARRTRAA